jgi:Uri superfamily endonuclease
MRGVYVLLIRVLNNINVEVGGLGSVEFRKGDYFYVGSALNNVESRINRHLRSDKKLHWHIDYLLNNNSSKIISYFVLETDNKSFECRIADELKKRAELIPEFGCTDCKCTAHLFYLIKT